MCTGRVVAFGPTVCHTGGLLSTVLGVRHLSCRQLGAHHLNQAQAGGGFYASQLLWGIFD